VTLKTPKKRIHSFEVAKRGRQLRSIANRHMIIIFCRLSLTLLSNLELYSKILSHWSWCYCVSCGFIHHQFTLNLFESWRVSLLYWVCSQKYISKCLRRQRDDESTVKNTHRHVNRMECQTFLGCRFADKNSLLACNWNHSDNNSRFLLFSISNSGSSNKTIDDSNSIYLEKFKIYTQNSHIASVKHNTTKTKRHN
jgi:hypothetical protein